MDNKYKDIVKSLVENHRKYKDYEPIIDEILNDIYEKAESVLNSIDDDSIITMYLDKVVSTSMVTVPKRLNFNVRRSKELNVMPPNDVEPVEDQARIPESNEFSVSESVLQEEDIEPIQEENPLTEELDIVNDNELAEIVSDDQSELGMFDDSEDIQDTDESYGLLSEVQVNNEDYELSENEENLNNDNIELAEKVDVTLVDKMINGISDDMKEDFDIETDESYDNLDMLDTSITIEQSDIISDEEPVEELEIQISDDSEDELISQSDFDNHTEEFKLPSYMGFKTDISVEEPDGEDVKNEISDLDSMYPDKHILQICELKYKDNKSVEEIADILSVSEDDVLEVLDEISRTAVNC